MKWTLYRPNLSSVAQRPDTYDPHMIMHGKRVIVHVVPHTIAEKRAIKFLVDAANEKEERTRRRK